MNSSPLPAIETVGLTKQFGDKLAVNDLNLQVKPGSTFGFIGPNGAGKTTTIRMMMNTLRRTTGEVRVLGMDVAAEPEAMKQRVGYVPELHRIHGWMRVHEVVGFCRGLYRHWNDLRCRELLRIFELEPHRKVKHLSKGMVVKLALTLAISHDPEVLILDEPTSGLDPIIREEFLDGVLQQVCERDATVLFSSHTLADVQRLADSIGIIYEGRLLACCPTDELLTGTKRLRAVLRDGGVPGAPPAGTIWQRVNHREWLLTVRGFTPATVESLRQEQPIDHVEVIDLSLEEIFKDMVKGRRAAS